MDLNHFDTQAEAEAAGGEALNRLLAENLNVPVLLLLSGGSALNILNYVNQKNLEETLTITMLDERFSQKPEANNFLQLQKLDFYSLALEKNVSFIGTLPRSGENADDLRARWEIALQKWREINPKGKMFATFGMGTDGHTAGIFPYPKDPQFFEATFENHHWLASYTAAGKHKYETRVTATLPFFKNIDEALMLVCGNQKRQAFEAFIKGKTQPHEIPALGIFQTKHYQIFTDIQ